jgi:hypothetical protein
MAAPSAPGPSLDASYLRRLLDRQPSCLIRVRLDGVLLACNDAALGLFGVAARRAVLDTNLTDRIVPADRTRWQEFTTRCWAKGAASLECHLVAPDDDARPVLVQGVALTDHPDGFESLLLNLRDQSQTHRLEHSIQAAEIDRLDNEERQRAARDQVDEAIAERQELAALADEHQAERRRLTEALEAQTADRQHREARFVELEKKFEESQRLLLQKEREHRRDIAMLKSALAAAHAAKTTVVAGEEKQELEAVKRRLQAAAAEHVRLEALVAEYEADRERIAADHRAAVDTLEQALARAGEEAALGLEQSRQALAESRSNLAQALAEQSRLTAHAEEQEREQDLLRGEHHRTLIDLETRRDAALAELRSQLERTTVEQGSLAARVEVSERELDLIHAEHHRTLADLEAGKGVVAELRRQLSQASAEQGRLDARIQEYEVARERLVAEHHRTLADVEAGKREALADLRSQQSQAFADQRRLAARVEEHELAHDRLIAEHRRALADMETGKREALAELRSQLSQAFADQRGLGARVEEGERERDRMRAEHVLAVADLQASKETALAELRSELSAAAVEHHRLTALLEEHDRERERTAAEHTRAISDLEANREAALAELRSELSSSAAEHHRLTVLLEEHDLEKERIAAEHRRVIADLQASKSEAVAECERVLTEVQQALLVRDASRFAIERRLIDGIDDVARTKVDGERLATIQSGWTSAFSRMKTALKDGAAPNGPTKLEDDEPEHPIDKPVDKAASPAAGDEELRDVQVGLTAAASGSQTAPIDVDPEHEPFDDADSAFVQHLLEGIHATPLPDFAGRTARTARAVFESQTVTTDDDAAHDVFDALDDTFACSLMMRTPGLPRESADQADAEALQELPHKKPVGPEDS